MAKKYNKKRYHNVKGKKPARKPLDRKSKIAIAAAALVVIAIIAALAVYLHITGAPDYPTNYVEIDIQDYGVITAELYGNTAPETVENFIELANEGFYDGLTFHRIIPGFMIQGGDPTGTGIGGSSRNIKGEFAANGVENNISHDRGVLSMARSAYPDSANSQFFIMHEATPRLDGNYAAFGRVLSGIEIVDAICENTIISGDNGTVAPADQPVISGIREIDKPAA